MDDKKIDLQEFLDKQERVDERFTIDDKQKANWALRKIRNLKKQKMENILIAEDEIAKIDAWLEQVNGELESQIQFFEDHLAIFAERLRAENPKFKSLPLPNGKIKYRKLPSKWNYDEKVLLEQLKENGRDDLIRIKEEVDKQQLKKRFKVTDDGRVIDPETGEILEGIYVEEQAEKLKIEVDAK